MVGRVREAWVTSRSAPWRRAPRLLWGHWGVLATVAAACAVLAAALAAVPLYLSSVGTAAVTLQVGERCPRDTGATMPFGATPEDVRTPGADPFRGVADQMDPAGRWVRIEELSMWGGDPQQDTDVALLTRDAAMDHVEALEGPSGPGVWITDRAAAQTGLGIGDTARINDVEVPVAAVYMDVAGSSVDDYWCSNGDLLLLEVRGGDLILPPPVVLADPATFASLMEGLDVDRARAAWEARLRPGRTVADTQELVPALACATPVEPALAWCASGRRPPVAQRRNRDFTADPIYAGDDDDFIERFLQSHLPFVNRRSSAIQSSVGGGVWPMAGFAALAGVGLVAASASLWFDRRRREVTLLTVRGVSPGGLGVKAVLELSVPSIVGCLAGIAAADGIVVWLGPSSTVEPGALGEAVLAGLAAVALAALTIWAVVTTRVRARDRHRRIPVGALPWELLLAWATVVSYRRLGDWGIPVGRGATVSRIDVWGLLFPVLFLVTVVAVVSRLLALAVRPLRRRSGSWPTSLYLAVCRVARYRVAVLGLVAASALASGVLGYAATMNRSLDATLRAKATTFVGSDVAARVADEAVVPAAVEDRATEVHLYLDAWIDDGGHESVAVVGIDPATFERAAYWDGTFADASLGAILDRLAGPVDDDVVPAVVVGIDVEPTAEVGIEEIGTTRFRVEQVAEVRSFPGMRKPKPTVFVPTAALAALELGEGSSEVWVRGDRAGTERAFQDAGIPFREERRSDDVADGAAFVTVTWTFGFMQSLGLSAGLLGLGGVAVYLDARRRDRLLGYAFMRRMGLTAPQHRRALLVELAASVVVGCWLGLGLAVGAAWLAHSRIDPVPSYEPAPLLRPARVTITTLAVLSALLAVTGGFLAQRRVDRDDPVEVLRAGV
jgi:putative ABC transport system permease protein